MEKVPVSLDADALRSFVTGVECGSFALAAQRLCRSPSAVSAQLKKLEAQCGAPLLTKQGRGLTLTPSGEILLSYARRLLALNDEAQRAIRGGLLQGEMRIGMQEDFGEAIMPEVLSHFSRRHPGLTLTARVDRNRALLRAAETGELDSALLWQPDEAVANSRLLGVCPLVWIASRQLEVEALIARGEPLPLVLFDAPCQMRARALAALDRAGIAWRIAFTSLSLSGIWAAVQANLGVTLRSPVGLPSRLRVVNAPLPAAGEIGIALWQRPTAAQDAQRQLDEAVVAALAPFLPL